MVQGSPAPVAFAHRLREALRSKQASPSSSPRNKWNIELRSFAGPAAFSEQLSHLRVAHLTDIHVGRVTPFELLKSAMQMTNEAKPDLVVMTGDFVCFSTQYLDQLTELVSMIEAPCVGVLGNHDHWSGADEVRRALRRGNMELLENQNTVITLRQQQLQLVGLDDSFSGNADRQKAVKGMRSDLPTLGLSHIGEEADGLWREGVSLVLAGHTHAGQITVAKLHELSLGRFAGHKYVHGLYGSRRRGAPQSGALYVGAGLGSAVLPVRLGERARPEIAMFELGYEPGAIVEHHGEQPPLPGRKPPPELLAKRVAMSSRKQQEHKRKVL